jgi:hypothetical protein
MDAAPVTEPLATKLHCVRCRYDLRGLDENSRCPECGLGIYWTLRAPEKLSQYPADWVSTMAWSVRLLMIAYASVFLLLIGESLEILPKSEILLLGVFCSATLLQLIGMWMLSLSSKHYTEAAAPINRWTLRIASTAMTIALALAVWATMQQDTTLVWLSDAFALVGAAAPTSIFIRLRTVARMIADPHLAEHSAIVGWGFLASIIFTLCVIILEQFIRFPVNNMLGVVLTMTAAVALLLFLLWGAFIFFACVVDFGRAARIAQAQWNTDQPPVSSLP